MHKRNGLTVLRVKRIRKPGRHGDGGGLYLAVSDTGAKSWVFMWKRGGVRHARGLGPADTVSLHEAREFAADARKAVRDGRDPPSARAMRTGVPTFGDCADKFITENEPGWSNAKHRYQWRQTLTVYAAPLRSKPVDQITTEQVLAVLQPLWKSKTETATRLRQRIEVVLDYAKALHHRTGENPARWRGHLERVLPAPERLARVVHLAAMPYAEVPAFMAKLRAMDGIGARALEFTILTAARNGEVRGAKWPEIDLAEKVWTVPAGRMKGGREHKVPLSRRVVTILRQMESLRLSDFVFPGFREERPLSDMALTAVLRRLGADVTVHGFRSTFRDWCGDCTSFPREIAEAALAHLVGDAVEQAYRRGNAFEKRAELMQSWANYCEPKAGTVISIHRRQGARRHR